VREVAMTDAERRRAERARLELSETESAFAEVRAALVDRLVGSPMEASAERERLYLAVNVLDSVRACLKRVVIGASDTRAIEEFVAAMKG
jgi:hypothetical protein